MSDLTEGVRSAHANPVYMSSKADIVEHYKQTYGKNWTSHAAQALSGTSDKHSKEYSRAIRQFQGSRLQQAGAKLAPKFEGVGKQLPPSSYTPKENSITVTVKGTQAGGSYKRNAAGQQVWRSSGTREREFTTTFSGPDAYQFVNSPSLRTFFKSMGYPDDVIEQIGDDGDYGVEVTSVS
jgi:hypothetical protein